MLVMSNLMMNGCWMPGRQRVHDLRDPLRDLELRVVEVGAVVEPDADTSETPCFDVLSTRSTPGEAPTARSMGWVIDFSMSAGPAPV